MKLLHIVDKGRRTARLVEVGDQAWNVEHHGINEDRRTAIPNPPKSTIRIDGPPGLKYIQELNPPVVVSLSLEVKINYLVPPHLIVQLLRKLHEAQAGISCKID